MKSLIKRLGIAYDSVLKATGYVGGMFIVLSACLVCYDTVMRWFFRIPSDWVFEYTTYMIGAAASLSAAFVLKEGGHINVDILVTRLSRSTRGIVSVVSLLLSSTICAVLTWSCFQMMLRAIAVKSVSNTFMETPLWIPQGFLFAGFTFLSVQAIRMTLHELTLTVRGIKEREIIERRTGLFKMADNPYVLLPLLFLALAVGIVLLDSGGLLRAAGVLILLFTILITGTPIFLSMALTGGIAFFYYSAAD